MANNKVPCGGFKLGGGLMVDGDVVSVLGSYLTWIYRLYINIDLNSTVTLDCIKITADGESLEAIRDEASFQALVSELHRFPIDNIQIFAQIKNNKEAGYSVNMSEFYPTFNDMIFESPLQVQGGVVSSSNAIFRYLLNFNQDQAPTLADFVTLEKYGTLTPITQS